MVFDRPPKPGSPRPEPATGRPGSTEKQNSPKPKKVITVGDNRSDSGSGSSGDQGGRRNGGGGGRPGEPSPWLLTPEFQPAPSASFVEYLRWMRSLTGNKTQDANTKVQLLQLAEDYANYRARLTTLTERTRRIAGADGCFQARCSWRMRVGGHRGPESTLLPAFDSLGMPYIPSSTLRGVARTQALRHFMADGETWQSAEKKVAPFFGSLEEKKEAHTGKVIFLDAYPLPAQSGEKGGLAVDMANNIWSWNANDQMDYSPNPNAFFSLKEPTFLIGLCPGRQCSDKDLVQVKIWLMAGLSSGIGSQVNTGYGELLSAGQGLANTEFFKVDFTLEGQLIHGRQRFDRWNYDERKGWQARTSTDAEVRSVAFKSMLRYWFRVFARGVLPPQEVKALEANLFGSISPQRLGWVTFNLRDGRILQREARLNAQGREDPCGEQSGTLMYSYSLEVPTSQQEAVKALFRNLTWMMFHLGGVGQGARRPCYSRQNREQAPWWRGSTLIPDSDDALWKLPSDVSGFKNLFRERLQNFYTALESVAGHQVNLRVPQNLGNVREDCWIEAVDANCRIIACAGDEQFGKPYALAVLHGQDFKRGQNYDGNLCGQVRGKVKPSPIWIADIDEYQVVTVFGATQDPRQHYVNELQGRTDRNNYAQIWPLA